jgi:uncharacterized coiled-coil protein SlyX
MKQTTALEFKTAAQAHARINQLEASLSLPLSALNPMINEAWDRIEQLEAQLAAKSTAAPPTKTTTQTLSHVDPSAPAKKELHGVERAAAALREGRTAKPTPTGDGMPENGWGKAARAQEARNQKLKS